jgi:pyruvate dehydrogenase E1 component alpha subunit
MPAVTTDAEGTLGGGLAPTPEPDLVQLLTPEGERVDHDTYSVDLTPDQYRQLYRDLVLVRRIDAEAIALQRQGELGIWASLLGQEAAQIGSGRALERDDYVFPTYREHGVAWCRDVDPLLLLGGVARHRVIHGTMRRWRDPGFVSLCLACRRSGSS